MFQLVGVVLTPNNNHLVVYYTFSGILEVKLVLVTWLTKGLEITYFLMTI